MIYRVGDNEITSYDYSSLKAAQTPNGGEKFNLNQYVDRQVPSDKEEKNEDSDRKETAKAKVTQKSGVKLDLSGKGNEKTLSGHNQAAPAKENETGESLFKTVRDLFAKFTEAVKNLFDRIWNDPPRTELSEAEDGQTEQQGAKPEAMIVPERLTEEYKREKGMEDSFPNDALNDAGNVPEKTDEQRDKEIRQYLHKGNLEQVLSILTDDGRRTIAKNSNLLTYYDKSGRLARINASDSERILHGDRNVRKL